MRWCPFLRQVLKEGLARAAKRDLGDLTGTPKNPIVAQTEPTTIPGEDILELYDRYARENAKGIKVGTLKQGRRDVKLFADNVGNPLVSRLDKRW
jgi:hypothetical protein